MKSLTRHYNITRQQQLNYSMVLMMKGSYLKAKSIYYIVIRSYPGPKDNPVGHTKKIMDILHNPKPPISSAPNTKCYNKPMDIEKFIKPLQNPSYNHSTPKNQMSQPIAPIVQNTHVNQMFYAPKDEEIHRKNNIKNTKQSSFEECSNNKENGIIPYNQDKNPIFAVGKNVEVPAATPVFFVDNDGVAHDKPSKTIKTKSGTLFNTFLDKCSDLSKWTAKTLLQEAKKRELLKKDDGATKSNLITLNDEITSIGGSYNDVKTTSHGSAYHVFNESPLKNNCLPDLGKNNYKIAIAHTNEQVCIVQTGQQRHPYIGIIHNNAFLTPGYMTGASQGIPLHKKRFDTFQKECENIPLGSSLNTKPQNIVEFGYLLKIPISQITILKHGSDYIEFVDCKNYFHKRFQELWHKPYRDYNPNGITREDLFGMCIDHDFNVENNKPHPTTAVQKQQEAKGKEKQKQINKDKINAKNKNYFNNEPNSE